MLDLIFDTETTGFARFNDSWEHSSQPHIVQIAAKLVENEKTYAAFQAIVSGDVPSSAGAFTTHMITESLRNRVGITPGDAARIFSVLLERANRLVAHNMKFDLILIGALFRRRGFDTTRLTEIPKFCTMLALTPVMKLPGSRGGYKWPKLEEAYKAYIDPAGFSGAHDAMADTIACQKLFEICKGMKLVPEGGKYGRNDAI